MPNTPTRLVDSRVLAYCEAHTSEEPDVCRRIRMATQSHPNAHWTVGPIIGTLLQTLIAPFPGCRALDIGTFHGYSCSYMASTNASVCVTTIESDEETYLAARHLMADTAISNRVHLILNDALTWISQCDQCFDLIFFDSERSNIYDFYSHFVRILRPGGMLVMDNSYLNGGVLAPKRPWEFSTSSFNTRLKSDPRFSCTILPVRDGLVIARRM